MGTMNQKEAVYAAICSVTGHTGEGTLEISKEQRAQVNMILFEGFRANKIQLDREFSDSDLKSYVSGLQSNWIRKDKRLNGGIAYTAKNPGSRAGSGDPELKALRNLMSTLSKPEDKAEVQGYIDARVAAINATKVTATVDFSALPADLQAKYSK
jgi:hypothetical protein